MRALTSTLLVLVLQLSCNGKTPGGPCNTSSDCASGETCAQGDCLPSCMGASECEAGQACVETVCREICHADAQCPEPGFICDDDVCIKGSRPYEPIITSVDADGSVHADPADFVAHHVASRLTIHGQYFEGAEVTLSGPNGPWTLDVCAAAPERLEVAMPTDPDLVSTANYTLRVATAAGDCDQTLPVLQGEAGQEGLPGPRGDAGGGLALQLELDEAAGATDFVDASPYASAATAPVGNITSGSAGHANNAVAFSGGVITVSAPNNIPDSPYVTVEAWILPQGSLTTTRTILIKEGAFALKQVNADLYFEASGQANPLVPCTVTSSGSLIVAGGWQQVTGSYDGLAVTVTIDGVVRGKAACAEGPLVATAPAALHVGGQYDGAVTEPYEGTIDEVRVWHTLPQRFASRGPFAHVVNVTVHENVVRRQLTASASIELERFTVDKKSATSTLLIQGTISARGGDAGDFAQEWRYGTGVRVLAQSVMYHGLVFSHVFPTTAVISGHTTTGPQDLVFRYFDYSGGATNRPFEWYNPNNLNDGRIGQTKSVYIVWEIEPEL